MMKRLVFTDLRRAQKKKAFIICMSVVVLLMIAVLIFAIVKPSGAAAIADAKEANGKATAFLNNISVAFGMISLLIGIPIFSTVFSDDFKSRTMQTAIGRGISRRRLILARFYEVIALMIESHLIFTVIAVIMGFALGASVGGIGTMVAKLWFDSLLILANVAIAMLILYLSQNATGGLVMFILLAADAFRLILALADMIPFLKDNGIKISNGLPSGVFSIAKNYLFGYVPSLSDVSDIGTEIEEGSAEAIQKILEGTINVDFGKAFLYTAILVGVFIVLPVFLSQVVFRKKELEF